MAPDEDRRELLLDALREVLQRVGPTAFLQAPLILPEESCFPDPYTADVRGVCRVALRLLAHARARDVGLTVIDSRSGDGRLLETHEIELTDVAPDELTLALSSLGDAAALPQVLAYRIAAGWRRARGFDRPDESAFRGASSSHDPDEELDALRDSLAAFSLGFGVLALLGAERYEAAGRVTGMHHQTEWAHQRDGAVDGPEAAFLLAVQLIVRDTSLLERRRIEDLLGPNQRADLEGWLTALDSERSALTARLEIDDDAPAAEPWELDVAPLDVGRARVVVPARRGANRGQPIFRVAVSRAGCLATLAILLAILPAALAIHSAGLVAGLSLLGIAGLLGLLLGRAHSRDECSDPDCEAVLPPSATTCERCEGVIRGRIRHRRDRLAAQEALEDEGDGGGPGAEQGS